MSGLEVLRTGALATVQDLGRPGLGRLGVGVSGAADRRSLLLANRLLGNDPGAAGVEVTFGGLCVRAGQDLVVALTGAPCPATLDGGLVGPNAAVRLSAGAQLELGVPPVGVRAYLAVRGGVAVEPVLGSRATDTLSGIGPPVLSAGAVLPIGAPSGPIPGVDLAPVPALPAGEVALRVLAGPRADWFGADALAVLAEASYQVGTDSDRVGMRLSGPALERVRTGELPSEGMVRGALQVPPTGRPTLLLADHPVTGGYPVIGVVLSDDVDRAAQARPGQHLRFRVVSGGGPRR